VLHQDGFLLRERVIAVYARRGAQNAGSLLGYSNTIVQYTSVMAFTGSVVKAILTDFYCNSSLFNEFVCKFAFFWHEWVSLKRE
jgi:hypothetical protein